MQPFQFSALTKHSLGSIRKISKDRVWYKSVKSFVLFIALSLILVGIAKASPVILTVNTSTDTPSTYPGGQTDASGATSGNLRYCINYILNQQAQGISQDYAIVFAPGIGSIQLGAKLSIVNLLGTDNISIGNPDPAPAVTIIGSAGTGGLFIRQGAVTLQNINFQNANATGGNGGEGGGGGMGAGGALFIDTANVTLHNVNFNNCSATAGLSGASGGGGGGGGLGGNGGLNNGGGGGGYLGNGGGNLGGGGGAGGDGGSNLGGGGGAILGMTGGLGGSSPIDAVTISPYNFLGQPVSPYLLGGGGYGSQNNISGGSGAGGNNVGGLGGYDGTNNIGGNGGNGGLPQMGTGEGGIGSNSTTIPGLAGSDGLLAGIGGGGGVYYNGNIDFGGGGGGGGGYSGGGGGGGSGYLSGGAGGGGGGLGGGGGGGFNANGGQGSLGGGAGGNSSIGGGGGDQNSGGFGAGGGSNGSSGTGGTSSLPSQGGNGAALGGAVFLGSSNGQPTLTLTGNCSTALNFTTNNAGGGFAGGDDFFLFSGTTLNLSPNTGETISISQSIIDDSVQAIPLSPNWQAGNGNGANLQVSGSGTVILNGINNYIGTTTVSAGTLALNGTLYAGGAGINSQTTISPGAILKGTGIINAPTTVSGTLSPGNSIGIITFNAPLILNGNLNIEIAPTAGVNSQVSSTSTVDVTGATIQITAEPGTYTPGTQYTLLISSGLTGTPSLALPPQFVGELSYVNNAIVLTLLSVPNSVSIPATVNGQPILNPAIVCCGRPILLGPLPIPGSGPTIYTIINHTGNVQCQIGQTKTQTYLKMHGKNGSCTIIGTKNGIVSTPLTVITQ